MAFDYFKPKKTGTSFSFANVSGAFKEAGFYYGQSGQIDEKLLFSTIIKAAHFIPQPKIAQSPLLEDIGEPDIIINEKGIIEDFYYRDYIVKPSVWILPENKSKKSSNNNQDNTFVNPYLLTNSGKETPSIFSILLNKRSRGDVKVYPAFGIKIGFLEEGTKYSLYFPYTQEGLEESLNEDEEQENNFAQFKGGNFDPEIQDFVPSQTSLEVAAIYVESLSYIALISFAREIFVKPASDGQNFVQQRNLYYSKVFADAYFRYNLQTSPSHIVAKFYEDIPDGLFLNLSNQTLIQDITKFVVYDALDPITDYSKIIVKILQNVPDPKSLYDSLYKDASFIFEMYNVVNGEANVTAFCNYLTALGLLYQDIQVSQVKDETENPKSGLKVVPMGEGYYFDLANFFVENNQVNIEVYTTYQELSETTSSASPEADFVTRRSYQIQEKFNPMDLVVLRNMDTGEEVVVCALYIQYLIDLGFWSSIIEAVVLIVNIISIFTAAGLIIKGVTGIIRILAIADIAVSSIDILLSNENFKAYLMKTTGGAWFVENWTKISMCLSMSTLSISLAQGIKSYSKEVIEHIDDAKKLDEFKNLDLDEPIDAITKIRKKADEVLEGAGLLNRGKYLGQAIEAADLEKIRNFLSKQHVDLQIGAAKGNFTVEGFLTKSGTPVEMLPHNAAMFITDGKIMKMILRENATVYEFLHEFMHFRHCRSLGVKKYFELGKDIVEGTIVRERYVFDKMVEHFKYLNRKELFHAEEYMNWYYKTFGITDELGNPITVSSSIDLLEIPLKRQGTAIDKILMLK